MTEKAQAKTGEVDLQNEIDMLHAAIERMYTHLYLLDDLEDLTRALGALGLATTRLAGLLRAQKQLGRDPESSVLEAIKLAIARNAEEKNLS